MRDCGFLMKVAIIAKNEEARDTEQAKNEKNDKE
jgi:hypothetical protein